MRKKQSDVSIENDFIKVFWVQKVDNKDLPTKIRVVCSYKRTLKTFYGEYSNNILYLDGEEYKPPFNERTQSILDCILEAASIL